MKYVITTILTISASSIFAADPQAPRGSPVIADCKKVAFSAVTSSGIKPRNTPLSYERTLHNGYGYDETSGIFTSKCPGLYQFSFSGSGNVKLSLRKRPSAATAAWKTVVETGSTGGSQTILLSTQVGEQVAVFIDSGTPSPTLSFTFTAYKIADV